MPRGKPNKRYAPEFKKLVIETMYEEQLSYRETAERFEIRHKRVQDWEHIYLTEGPEGLAVDRRGRRSKGRPPKQKMMKHEIEITHVIALLDEVLLVIFEDKTLHVHDAELIRNRLPDIRPFSEPETMQAVEANRERCLVAWSEEIDGAACGRTEETVEVNVDVDTDVLELTEQWCVKANVTAEKLMLALLRFVANPENEELSRRLIERMQETAAE